MLWEWLYVPEVTSLCPDTQPTHLESQRGAYHPEAPLFVWIRCSYLNGSHSGQAKWMFAHVGAGAFFPLGWRATVQGPATSRGTFCCVLPTPLHRASCSKILAAWSWSQWQMIAVNVAVANSCAAHRVADLFVMMVMAIVLQMLMCINPFYIRSCNVLISTVPEHLFFCILSSAPRKGSCMERVHCFTTLKMQSGRRWK